MPLVSKTFSQIITFTRASTATYFDATGTLQSAAIGAPRFDYDPATLAARGFLIEEARTNSIRNNTMQGAVAGTPGTLPTNWGLSVVTTTGLTTSVDSVGTENGLNYVDLKISGTSVGAGTLIISFENTGVITASSGQTWAGSLYWKIAAGTLNGLSSFQYRIDERLTVFLASVTLISGQTPTTAALATQRISGSGALANASTTNIQPYIRATIANGAAIDITLRIGLPQLELGAFATSVIPTTTTALTRSDDVASVNTLSPWYNQTAGTIYSEASLFGFATTPAVTSFSDGTDTGNLIQTNTSGAGLVRYRVTIGGVAQVNNLSSGVTATANTTFKTATGYAASDFAISVNGTSAVTQASGNVPTPTQLRLLQTGSGGSVFSGYLRRITYYPRRLSNAELQGLTA